MKAALFAALIAGGVTMAGAGIAPASAMPAAALHTAASGDVVQVWHNRRPHRAYRHKRQRIVVYPQGYAYPDYYATSRGFEDPGFAVRGNMPGCAVDLGYGRWESCDK